MISMDYWLKVVTKYADFSGRASRAEYWNFMLFNLIFFFAISFLDILLGTFDFEIGRGILGTLYIFATIIPSLSVTIRRLHDVGESGWMHLIVFVPIFGPIYLLYLLSKKGDPGKNEYGPKPKF